MDFNLSISRTIQHLSDFVFEEMPISTASDLALNGTLTALRTSHLHLVTLLLDSVLKKPEGDIVQLKNEGYSGSSSHKKGCYHPCKKSLVIS